MQNNKKYPIAETIRVMVTGLTETSAHILNIENMKHGELPILDIWVRLIRRAFVTHEVLKITHTPYND